MNRESYSYWLTVDGTDEDRKAVFTELSKQEDVIGSLLVASDIPEFTQYEVPQNVGTVDERSEEEVDRIFHEVALAVPNAVLTLEAINEDRKLTAYIKRFYSDMYQETRPIITLPPLQEDKAVPFADRAKLQTEPVHRKVFLLCEEFENADAIRTFTVLAASEDRGALRKLMRAKIAKDEHGVIADNGIREDAYDYFSSEYGNDSGVEYYILEENIQTREQTLELLQTPEYSDAFIFPDNMRQILLGAVRAYTENENYGTLDNEKIADAIMADKSFHSVLKKSFWFNKSLIFETDLKKAEGLCYEFLGDKLAVDDRYFDKLGVIPVHSCPQNLKGLVIGSIYDVAKELHLPVLNAEEWAGRIIRNNDFLKEVATLSSGQQILQPDTDEYRNVSAACYIQVVSSLTKDMADALQQGGQKGRRLEDLIKGAEARISDTGKSASPLNLQR